MNIDQYIQSGIIEAYALGLATQEEAAEFETLLPHHPQLQKALYSFEVQLEKLALQNQAPPPPETWDKIKAHIRPGHIIKRSFADAGDTPPPYIPISEASSTHIRVHKYWRWAFIAVFILGKIFLALAIYYYILYSHTEESIRQLQQQEQPAK